MDNYAKILNEQNKILKNGLAAMNENLTSIAKMLIEINEKLQSSNNSPGYTF